MTLKACANALWHTPVPIAIASSDGLITFANPALRTLLGSSDDECTEKSISSCCFDFGSHHGICLDNFSEGKIEVLSASNIRVPVLLSVSKCSEDDLNEGNYFFLVFQVLSKVEDRSQPRSSAKLESLGSLARGIAHDLNNILTGVLGHVSFLRLCVEEDGPQVDSLTAIEDGARRAALMTREILGYARNETTEIRPVNLSLVVAAGLNLLKGALPKNITLEVDGDETDLFVLGDESKLSQVFMNLAVNARDALPNGGCIEVSVEEVVVSPVSPFLSNELEPGKYARLSISDNGMGMAPDVRARIFEACFTTKSSAGTGVGLATVLSIIDTHSGVIDVSSTLGKGTRFDVYIPFCDVDSEDNIDVCETSLPSGYEKILVVDDEEVVRTVIRRSLEHFGYQVDVAKDGVEALSRYRHDAKSYRLVILDMMMPHLSGEEVFKRLKEIDTNVRVLLVSGFSSEDRAEGVLKAGGLGFIQKPFAVEELAREVRRCLDVS